ncbi:thylakoid lumenal 15 kDa 1, chloroplastic [Olea europaea subsp. europaea]|uniref:Thylakoid lumenal 15 kDa 1, chloroplastic n=1 Tax=Olea europaea subsp. europaea TaxID=158383 RepID=A0A8S0PBH6_OLEEU|nr:thylakoid lumenal 15 kDa 1, chloroplastic [Olea europaea subsp. europaea]
MHSFQGPQIQNHLFSLCESISKAIILAVLSASLVFASNSDLAFKKQKPFHFSSVSILKSYKFIKRSAKKYFFLATLRLSILRQANIKGAKLIGASFFDANITGADLSDADLRGANFSLANVTKVLRWTVLHGTKAMPFLSSICHVCSMQSAFTDVPLRDDQREYLCEFANGLNLITGCETRETLLCK